jgi:hypothetical protein
MLVTPAEYHPLPISIATGMIGGTVDGMAAGAGITSVLYCEQLYNRINDYYDGRS